MSSTISKRFDEFYQHFAKTELAYAMKNTREDSPWHRESSVFEHTRMLIDWYYRNLYSQRNDQQRMQTLVACLFHDVGKPPCEIMKFKEDRGHYRAYHGHEQVSARLWVDYAIKNRDLVTELLRFTDFDVANIAMMLEHHLPFDLQTKKLAALKIAINLRMGEHGQRAWLDLLLSDQHGRISDDQATKLARVDEWMIKWECI